MYLPFFTQVVGYSFNIKRVVFLVSTASGQMLPVHDQVIRFYVKYTLVLGKTHVQLQYLKSNLLSTIFKLNTAEYCKLSFSSLGIPRLCFIYEAKMNFKKVQKIYTKVAAL